MQQLLDRYCVRPHHHEGCRYGYLLLLTDEPVGWRFGRRHALFADPPLFEQDEIERAKNIVAQIAPRNFWPVRPIISCAASVALR